MTGEPEPLSTEEETILDRFSGTQRLPADEVEQIVEDGRRAAREARMPEGIPHLDEIIAAFPEHHRDALSVSRFINYASIDYLGGEVGVREYLESGADPEPVVTIARQADSWGM